MPAAVYERAFRVRLYECDAYGHVNHANYLRYIQEAALEASSAVGYSVERYREMGRTWLIRETDITYLRPLSYGDAVIVRTWVDDFRRVRSRRQYEMRLEGSDEPVASARTEWVYLDASTLRPVSVPPEMVSAFYAGEPPVGDRREPFPEPPPPPEGIFRMRRPVEWRDIDPAGHVNNANYLAYIEECNMAVAVAHRWPMERIMAAGFGIVARRYRIEYRDSARHGDEVEVTTYVSDVKRSTATRHNDITRVSDGTLLVRANALWVWVDLRTGRPTRIPQAFIDDFSPNVVFSR
jgi:acyl-CoA thioester hydrolase